MARRHSMHSIDASMCSVALGIAAVVLFRCVLRLPKACGRCPIQTHRHLSRQAPEDVARTTQQARPPARHDAAEDPFVLSFF